jgi:hypothetical protein
VAEAAALCLAGVCTPGDCRTDADCPTMGQICGASQPNTCGGCTHDAQCKADPTYGPGHICKTSTGTCVADACANNNQACAANSADFCCAGHCVSGNCCATAQCTGANQTCVSNQCPPVANNTYYVDPLNGSDAVATGSGATGGMCAFKTLTHALAVIGSPKGATKVEILNTATVGVSSGETFHRRAEPRQRHDGQPWRCGLIVRDNGHASITVNAGGTAAAFDSNTSCGIGVEGAGSITIGGTANPAVTANKNNNQGLYIAQKAAANAPNVVSNFQANGSVGNFGGPGDGIAMYAGSSLKLRNSSFSANQARRDHHRYSEHESAGGRP